MTTTEPAPPLAEWERRYRRRGGYLPEVDTSTSGDPDFLAARLREMLADGTRIAESREHGEHTDSVVLAVLEHNLARIAGELEVHGARADEMADTLRRICPAVSWSRDAIGNVRRFQGRASIWALADPIEQARRWLRLRPDTERPGWVGVIEGWRVELRPSDPDQIERRRAAIGADAADYLAAVPLHPIAWNKHRGLLSANALDATGDLSTTVAERWASALGLTLAVEPGNWVRYRGITPVGPVEVVSQVDR